MKTLNGQKFALGVRLKEFGVYNADMDYNKIEMKDQQKKSVSDRDLAKLTYKIAKIDGFSIFCDYEEIDKPENGGIYLNRLQKEDMEKIRGKASEF